MKYKTSELRGPKLNCAVAKALGLDYKIGAYLDVFTPQGEGRYEIEFRPCAHWEDCGPLIRQFKIDHITWHDNICEVSTVDDIYSWGEDELEAICRVVVKTKFGDEVEL